MLNRRLIRGYVGTGTLAVVAEGQLPREVLGNVHLADWAPDGTALAIVRDVQGRTRLEFPIGTVLFETSGWISDLRFSPDGSRIAFVEHPLYGDAEGWIFVSERAGEPRMLSPAYRTLLGLAWSKSGDEIWFTAEDGGGMKALRAVDLAGRARVVTRAPGRLRLLDIDADGRMLLARDDLRLEAIGMRPGETRERNLSWLDWSLARDISPDGARLLIVESGEAVGPQNVTYIRPMDGAPVTRLGFASGLALSPDGRSVLSITTDRMVLLPVGAGAAAALAHQGISYHPYAGFFPDGRRVVFTGNEPGRGTRLYVQEVSNGRPAPITPEGFRLSSPSAVSPDGRVVVAVNDEQGLFLFSTSGGTPQPLAGANPGEVLAQWDTTGRAVFVFESSEMPARVFRLGLDGRRELWRTLAPEDLAGAIVIHRLVMTHRGDGYAYTLERQLSELYIATELPERTLSGRLLSRIPWPFVREQRGAL